MEQTEDQRKLAKLYYDVYEGDGKDNPSMTSRMALLENIVKSIQSNFSQMKYIMLAALLTMICDIVVRLATGK